MLILMQIIAVVACIADRVNAHFWMMAVALFEIAMVLAQIRDTHKWSNGVHSC